MQIKSFVVNNISFPSPQRQRVDWEYTALKSDLLEKGYELTDIESFFLNEIEVREKRNALGFLDPERTNNDLKDLKDIFPLREENHQRFRENSPGKICEIPLLLLRKYKRSEVNTSSPKGKF